MVSKWIILPLLVAWVIYNIWVYWKEYIDEDK